MSHPNLVLLCLRNILLAVCAECFCEPSSIQSTSVFTECFCNDPNHMSDYIYCVYVSIKNA